MTNRVVVQARQVGNRFLGSLKGLQIRALAGQYDHPIPIRFLPPQIVYKFQHSDLFSKNRCLIIFSKLLDFALGRRYGLR
jgi:hypothetical protein